MGDRKLACWCLEPNVLVPAAQQARLLPEKVLCATFSFDTFLVKTMQIITIAGVYWFWCGATVSQESGMVVLVSSG